MYATKIHQSKSAIYGECNTGLSVIKEKKKMGTLDTWINPEVISNIISKKRLEKSG